jgi:hypothetical protein
MKTPVRRWQRTVVTLATIALPLFGVRASRAGDLPPGPWWKPPGHQTVPPGGGPPIDHHGQPPPPPLPSPVPPPPPPPPFIPTGNTPPPDTPNTPNVPETPEPATLVLALVGTGVAVGLPWRKRRAVEQQPEE